MLAVNRPEQLPQPGHAACSMMLSSVLSIFPASKRLTVQDDPSKQEYPMPLYTSEKDDVYVGRLRRDESCEKSYNMWVVGDQIRKGAALNTLQIAETMIKNGWI